MTDALDRVRDMEIRQSLLHQVDAIERRWQVDPRTSEVRKYFKAMGLTGDEIRRYFEMVEGNE